MGDGVRQCGYPRRAGAPAPTSALTITSRSVQGATVVRPAGELNLATAPTLRAALVERASEEPRAVIVDLAELTITRSSLLSVLSVVWSRMRLWSGLPLIVVGDTVELSFTMIPANVQVYPTVDAAVAAVGEAPTWLRSQRRLPALLSSPAAARRFVVETCAQWPIDIDDETVQAAVTIVNELVENVIRHTPVAEMRVRVEWHSPWLHVAVADGDLHLAVLREPTDDDSSGRGLVLVSQLSHTWGCTPHPNGGKVVWATLALRSHR